MHDDRKQEPLRVDLDLALAPSEFLASIEAAQPASERFDGLTVNDGRVGTGLTPGMEAGQLAQHCMDAHPGPIELLAAEIVIDRLPGAVLARQIPPGAAGAQNVRDAISDAADVNRAWPAIRLSRWDQ